MLRQIDRIVDAPHIVAKGRELRAGVAVDLEQQRIAFVVKSQVEPERRNCRARIEGLEGRRKLLRQLEDPGPDCVAVRSEAIFEKRLSLGQRAARREIGGDAGCRSDARDDVDAAPLAKAIAANVNADIERLAGRRPAGDILLDDMGFAFEGFGKE